MRKIDKLINNLNEFISKAEKDDDITNVVADFAGLEALPVLVEDYETELNKLLKRQRKLYTDSLQSFKSKSDSITMEIFLNYLKGDLFASDDFAEKVGGVTAEFLTLTIKGVTKIMMESIDKDVPFQVLSQRTLTWIEDWSSDLGELMQLNSHKALEKALLEVIQEGESIAQAEQRMKDLPQFDRKRARATARTEILTASSQAHYESFIQSPAVVMKKWKHSGTKNIKPRETHQAMDGVELPLEEPFEIEGELGLYPRDVTFSAKNRVNCGCVIGPVVDEAILGLSKEEKESIRQQVLDELNQL